MDVHLLLKHCISLHEGAANPAQVDAVMRDCAHFRMGPFELMDLTGVDINYPASLIMHEQNSYDPRIRTVPYHKSLFDAGKTQMRLFHNLLL